MEMKNRPTFTTNFAHMRAFRKARKKYVEFWIDRYNEQIQERNRPPTLINDMINSYDNMGLWKVLCIIYSRMNSINLDVHELMCIFIDRGDYERFRHFWSLNSVYSYENGRDWIARCNEFRETNIIRSEFLHFLLEQGIEWRYSVKDEQLQKIIMDEKNQLNNDMKLVINALKSRIGRYVSQIIARYAWFYQLYESEERRPVLYRRSASKIRDCAIPSIRLVTFYNHLYQCEDYGGRKRHYYCEFVNLCNREFYLTECMKKISPLENIVKFYVYPNIIRPKPSSNQISLWYSFKKPCE